MTLLCNICNKQKHELTPRKSRLMKNQTLLSCEMCYKAKMEPRWLIILYGRANGPQSVSEYIRKKLYVGEEILAKELTT